MDIEPNAIRTEAFRAKNPPITDLTKLKEKEKQWEVAPGILFLYSKFFNNF